MPGRTYILIGHSDGGSINLIFGAEKPALLMAIITEAPHVFVEPETLRGIAVAEKAYDNGQFRGLAKYHGEKAETVFRTWVDTWCSEWFTSWNIEYLLPSIVCPLLILQGRQDQYGTDRQVATIVAKASGQARSVFIENCGHTPHQEQPEKVLQIFAEYIGRLLNGCSQADRYPPGCCVTPRP